MSNCTFSHFGNGAVGLVDCLNSTLSNCTFSDVFMTGMGYAVCLVNACDNTNITQCNFITKGRHYFDTGSMVGTNIVGGFPKRIYITDCNFSNSTDYAIHTHATFDGTITISGCTFTNDSGAIQVTNGTDIVNNCTIDNCPGSIGFVTMGGGYTASASVTGTTISDSEDGVNCSATNEPTGYNACPDPPTYLLTVNNTTFTDSSIEVGDQDGYACGPINGVLIENSKCDGAVQLDAVSGSPVNNVVKTDDSGL